MAVKRFLKWAAAGQELEARQGWVLLGLLGVVLIYSATLPAQEGAPSPGFGGPAARQLVYLAVAAVAFGVAVAVDYHVWAEFSWLLYGGAITSLVPAR